MTVPQIILTLAANGSLVAELPGPAGRRQVQLSDDPSKAIEVIKRVLVAQARDQGNPLGHRIGHDSAPTQAQVIHWQRHCGAEAAWSDPMCTFCISEGRFDRDESEQAAENRRARIERRQSRNLATLGNGADSVEVRRSPNYRSRFVLVRDENEATPVIMLREEARAAGLKPIEAEQRTTQSAEEMGL